MAKFRGLTTGTAASSFANAASIQVRGAETVAGINRQRIGRLQQAVGGVVSDVRQNREIRRQQGNFERQQAGIESQRQIMALANIAQEDRMMYNSALSRQQALEPTIQELRTLASQGAPVGDQLAAAEKTWAAYGQQAKAAQQRWEQGTRAVMERFSSAASTNKP